MKPARRTQTERREETRAVLLRAAVDVIARKGFAEASLQEIADAAGISKGALHYHFRAKDDLVEPVLERCAAHVREVAASAWRQDGPPAERMRRALRAMWQTRREGGVEVATLADLVTRAVHDERVRASVAAMFRRAEEDLGREIASAIAALGLRPRVPAEMLPRLLLAVLDGFTLHGYVSDDRGDEALAALETLAFSLFTI
jgi:AcrR family transcriptional regulator